MSLPVLLAVDEDQRALEAVETQLAQRYAHDYRIETQTDPGRALRRLTELRDAGEEVALVLVAKPPLDATGGELLERARQLHPHAKRGLVVAGGAWTDPPTAEAILDSMALGRIDYYVAQPAGSPDEVFHQAISSFLLEWATERRMVPHTVHIVGEAWSGRAYELRKVFDRCAAPHSFCLADSEQGRELLAMTGPGAKLPLMVLPDGRVLSDPSNAEIADAAGAPVDFDEQVYDIVIVGSGPAGLSAAVYGASEGLRTLVVDEGGIGGQARSSSLIRNYLGFPSGVSGSRLAEQAYEQASVFGASFVFMHAATALGRSGDRLGISLRRPAPQRRNGDPGHRRQLPPLGRSVARGLEWRRRLLRRPSLGGSRAHRKGCLHCGWRELGRPGRIAPCALRASRHGGCARRIARGRDVALPCTGGQGHPERGSTRPH